MVPRRQVSRGLPSATDFSDFTPLPESAGPNIYEGMPITFGNPDFMQRSIARRNTQLDDKKPNSGNFDMNTVNETGKDKARYLFTVFESATSGVQRHDLATGETDTVWQVAPGEIAARFDPATWSPWGTLITGEENWGCADSVCGRLFELRNPLSAPAIFEPVDASSNDGADFVHRNAVPRSSHEGLQFDSSGNMYFVDELNGGSIYKYVPAASMRRVLSGKAEYFAAGQTFVLRVGDGNTPNASGAYAWVPITGAEGEALPGAVMVTDANGVTAVDARNTADLAEYKGTDYQRPEDAVMQTVRGREYLYVATTSTHEVYRLDLKNNTISVFADRNTLDLATGAPVGSALSSPDNLAVDRDGNIYIAEDRNGGTDDDIWFARDLNRDGDLNAAGEGLARWASNGTVGSEFTGLYFDPFHKDRAWVNIQPRWLLAELAVFFIRTKSKARDGFAKHYCHSMRSYSPWPWLHAEVCEQCGRTEQSSGATMNRISDSLHHTWRNQGWIRFDNLLDPATIAKLPHWLDELATPTRDPREKRLHHFERTDHGAVICRTERYLDDHAGLRELITLSALPVVASHLLDGRAVLYKEKVNYKCAGGAGFAPHQDATAYSAVKHHVTCLVAVDAMTIDNGCLEFAQGAFNTLLPDNGDGCLDTDSETALHWKPVPLPAGGVLFFSSLAPHRSGPNRTTQSRRALYLTYNNSSEGDQREKYYAARHAALQLNETPAHTARISTIGHFQGRAVTHDWR